jgi:hypothetical protein
MGRDSNWKRYWRLLHGRAISLALMLGITVMMAACASSTAPSETDYAAAWNSVDNGENQRQVADSDFTQAVVAGWTIKSGDEGCSVTFLRGQHGPWVTYMHQLTTGAEPSSWDLVRRHKWGEDRAEGGPEEANAALTSDGTVRIGVPS